MVWFQTSFNPTHPSCETKEVGLTPFETNWTAPLPLFSGIFQRGTPQRPPPNPMGCTNWTTLARQPHTPETPGHVPETPKSREREGGILKMKVKGEGEEEGGFKGEGGEGRGFKRREGG